MVRIGTRATCWLGVAVWVGAGAMSARAQTPQQWAFTITEARTTVQLDANGTGRPAIVWEDTSERGVPIDAVKVGGVRLGKRILSGSRFELYPDRLGTWSYGFGMRRFPEHLVRADAAQRNQAVRQLYPFRKALSDPATPFTSVRVYPAQAMMMFRQRGVRAVSYPLDFGPDLAAYGLLVNPWRALDDGTGGAGSGVWARADKAGRYELEVVVSRDQDGRDVVARQALRHDQLHNAHHAAQFYLHLPGVSRFFVTLRQAVGDMTLLAGGGMTVYLRHVGKDWPALTPGANRLAYAESSASPGPRRVEVRLDPGVRWPGFEGDLSGLVIRGTGRIDRVGPASCRDSFLNGAGYVRLTPVAGQPLWSTRWQVPERLRDMGRIRAVRITYRVSTWCGRVQIDGTGPPKSPWVPFGAPPLVPCTRHPTPQWRTGVKVLPDDWHKRRDICTLSIRAFGPTWSVDPKAERRSSHVDIGCIELVPFAPGEREQMDRDKRDRAAWVEAARTSPIVRRLQDKPLPSGPRVHPRDILCRGVWGVPVAGRHFDKRRIGCTDRWDYLNKVLDDLKAHHLNAIHFEMAGVRDHELETFVKLAHEKGMHLWGCYSFLAFLYGSHPTAPEAVRKKTWAKYMKRWEAVLRKYKDVPTFVAWEVGEEPYRESLPYVWDSRRLMHRLGAQPQIMIHNKADVLLEDAQTDPRPGGVAMDSYVFLTLHVRPARYIDYLKTNWEGAKHCRGAAWFTPQLIGGTGVYLSLTRAHMRFQVWTAVAYNVKGFFPWAYGFAKNGDFSDKDYYGYYADEMARLAAIERLLVAIQRKDDLRLLEDAGKDVLVGCFEDRTDPTYRFAVVVNLNTKTPAQVRLAPVKPGDAVLAIRPGGGSAKLEPVRPHRAVPIEPGDGLVLFVGHAGKGATVPTRYWP